MYHEMKEDNHKIKLPDEVENRKGENPFIVPHNYFKNLPDEILGRIHSEEEEVPKSVSWIQQWIEAISTRIFPRPVMALAIVLLVAIMVWWPRQKDEQILALQHLEQEEIAAYIEANIDEFNEMDFYTDEAANADPMEESLQEDNLAPLVDDLLEDVDIETLENIL